LPINGVASLVGLAGGACSSAAYERVTIADGLTGIRAMAPGADASRVILYFHGGGHWMLTADTYREFIGRLSAVTGACVVAVAYRKPPDVQFPAGLDDAQAAWHWARAQGAAVAVAGDSSGGNLAFALVVKLAQIGQERPVACIGISPWLRLDLKEYWWDYYGRFCSNLYLGGRKRVTSPEDPLVTPLYADAALVARFPPVVMHAGRNELTTQDVKEMQSVCERAGATVEVQLYSAPHIFQVLAGFPQQTRDSLARIGDFLNRYW